jgi:phosphoribosyl-ATP pyrophosphohydrolase
MSYHKNKIIKGELKEFSKIVEEFSELVDAYEQGDKVLQICEMTDLIGAIGLYSKDKFNLTIEDLIDFSNKTKEAFKSGKRK